MNEVYINAKKFMNNEISLLFGKDLISVEELIDKIYELQDRLDLAQDRIEELENENTGLDRELTSAKLGFKPSDNEFPF